MRGECRGLEIGVCAVVDMDVVEDVEWSRDGLTLGARLCTLARVKVRWGVGMLIGPCGVCLGARPTN